jgi:hypothetical protein
MSRSRTILCISLVLLDCCIVRSQASKKTSATGVLPSNGNATAGDTSGSDASGSGTTAGTTSTAGDGAGSTGTGSTTTGSTNGGAATSGSTATGSGGVTSGSTGTSSGAPAGPPWIHIGFDGSDASLDGTTWNLTNAGASYSVVLKGAPTTEPWIADFGFGSGGHSLAIRLDPTTGLGPDNGRDKINYTVLTGNDAHAPGFDGLTQYLGFAVQVGTDFVPPPSGSTSYIIAQWWQGAPFGPPLSVEIVPNTNPPQFVFVIRNNATGANPSAATIVLTPTGQYQSLTLGTWYSFVVGTQFDFQNNAALNVWVNGEKAVTWPDAGGGSIGYDPSMTPKTYTSGLPNTHFDIYFGPYRDRMSCTQTFYYDQINYAGTYESAVPVAAP